MGLPSALCSPLLIYSHLLHLPPCNSAPLAEEGGKVAHWCSFFCSGNIVPACAGLALIDSKTNSLVFAWPYPMLNPSPAPWHVGDGKVSGLMLPSTSWLCSLGNAHSSCTLGIEPHLKWKCLWFFFLVCLFFFPTAATGLSALPLPVNKLGLWDNKNSVLQKKQGVF